MEGLVDKEPIMGDRSNFLEYMLQDRILFHEKQLCIQRGTVGEILITEAHIRVLVHFEKDKTLGQLEEHHYWSSMTKEVTM